MNHFLKHFAASLAAIFMSVSAFAQVTSSTLSGKVSDPQGAIAGAAVTITHVPTGINYNCLTDNNGNYRVNGLTPGGPYTITVEMLGYRKVSVTEVYATLAENTTTNFALEEEVLGLDAAVFVADAADSKMNANRSGVSTSINQKTMNSIPTVSRSLNDIMKLTPQATTTTSGFAVGGGTYRGSSITVDGSAFNNSFGIGSNLPAGGTPISIDAIEQISINITPFDVRQSGFQGGAVNAVTKSGSNEFKASAYNYYTSEKFQGNKVAGEKVSKSESLNNTVGFTVGGPIIKNKLFYFVNAEYTFDTVPGSSRTARPSAGDAWGDDTSYNRPLASELDDIKAFLGQQFGYDPGRYQGYSLETPDYKVLARIDWHINDNNKLNVRYSHTHNYYSSQPSSSMSPIGGTNSSYVDHAGNAIKFNRYSAGRQSKYSQYFESARYYQEQNFSSLAAELNTRLLDGKGNNTFRLSWSHQDEPRSFVGDLFPTVDILDTRDVTGTDTHAMITTFGVDPFTYGNLRDVTTLIATDEFSYTSGIHNVLAGVQAEWNRAINGFMQGGAGWYIYESWDAFKEDVLNPSATTGPAAFMITHANLEDPTKQAFPTFDYTQFSAYAQDEINFSDYFKLTAGVRFELPVISIPTDNENKDFSAIAAANPNSSFAGLSTANLPANRISVSPRIGFNWDVLKDRSLIVRGGTGIYNGRIPNVWLVSAVGNANCLQYQYINKNVSGTNAAGQTNIHFHQNRNDVINQLYGSNPFVKADLSAPTGATIISKDLKMPSSWKTSLAVDATLPGGVKASLEGVYSLNSNEIYVTQLNYKEDDTIQLPGEPEPRKKFTSEGIKNNAGSNMGGYYLHNTNLNGHYYSVTAQLSKSFYWGLDLMAAYTHSNSVSVTDGNGDQVYEFANTTNRHGSNVAELGQSSYVTPNRAIASASYTIKEGSKAATKIALFYEGYNIGYFSSYSYARMSYLMNGVSGVGSASQTLYIPTESDLAAMPFVDDANKAAYASFIAKDSYLSKHRGEYMTRGAITAPWLNRINVKLAQEFYFNIAGRKHTLELSADINNVGNMLNSNWGVNKILSSNVILEYKNDAYKFSEPTWSNYNSLSSTWSMLFSAKWSF